MIFVTSKWKPLSLQLSIFSVFPSPMPQWPGGFVSGSLTDTNMNQQFLLTYSGYKYEQKIKLFSILSYWDIRVIY